MEPESGCRPRLKVCGLRQPDQARAVASLGVDAMGVIGVAGSPRFVAADERASVFAAMAAGSPGCQGVLVVADPSDDDLATLAAGHGHAVVQLHGQESVERCAVLRERLGLPLWKAVRVRSPQDLDAALAYAAVVDALLLDAWVPDQLGGTGHRIPIEWLEDFAPPLPWWLAGGLSPERLPEVLRRLQPQGLDVSSGVEDAPGVKNLGRVRALVAALDRSSAAGTAGFRPSPGAHPASRLPPPMP
ncbi:phosphoribosylanthranilate isomerase [Cyanobium sp. FGCU-6]|nr:phosphoribosylanthranilate isomerase [Cyanobium sp. FGCU6]